MSNAAPDVQLDQFHSYAETERLALAAAEAIKRLVAERNALRSRVTVLDRELLRLLDHFTLIRNSYRKLANELITQLQFVDKLERGRSSTKWIRRITLASRRSTVV
jgi:hypothetical protein